MLYIEVRTRGLNLYVDGRPVQINSLVQISKFIYSLSCTSFHSRKRDRMDIDEDRSVREITWG